MRHQSMRTEQMHHTQTDAQIKLNRFETAEMWKIAHKENCCQILAKTHHAAHQ